MVAQLDIQIPAASETDYLKEFDDAFYKRVLAVAGVEALLNLNKIATLRPGTHVSYSQTPGPDGSIWNWFLWYDKVKNKWWPILIRFKWWRDSRGIYRLTSSPGFEKGTENIIVPKGCPRKRLHKFVATAIGREKATDYNFTRAQIVVIFCMPGMVIGGSKANRKHTHHKFQTNHTCLDKDYVYRAASDDTIDNLEVCTPKEHADHHKKMGDHNFYDYYETARKNALESQNDFDDKDYLAYLDAEDVMQEVADYDPEEGYVEDMEEVIRRQAEAYNLDWEPQDAYDDKYWSQEEADEQNRTTGELIELINAAKTRKLSLPQNFYQNLPFNLTAPPPLIAA